MNFKDFCDFLEQVRETKTPTDKFKLLRDRLSNLRESSIEVFPILRLILPNLDRDRDSYNMKEAKVARTLIKMLDLPPGNDKTVLSKSFMMAGKAADFGDVVYSVIRKYMSNTKTTLTIQELNIFLDDLTKRKSESEAEEILMKMFKKLSPESIRWVIRIILKDLKLGIGSNSILNSYHKDGASFYASNNSLRKVCDVLVDETVKLHELEIQIFEPFRPMLSKRIDAGNFKKEFPDDKLFYIENKFDGERFQLHMNDNKFKYFSRNGFDYTNNLGDSFKTGILTPKLKGIFNNNVRKTILDGEMMLWDNRKNKLGSKGMTLDVKKLGAQGPYQPCFCVYDVILLNEEILTNKPLKERLKHLTSVFKMQKPGVIVQSEVKEVSGRQEIINELNTAVNNEDEGIIVKDPNSIYKYSDRKSGWFKMKLEYFEDVMNDLDVIVMGGQYASSTSDQLNSFVVGIRSGKADNGKPLYLALGKVSSGLTDADLEMLNNKLKSEGANFDKFSSQNLLFGKEVPNIYIEPEFSTVFQIRATELIRSTDHSFKTPYTLRFPRVLKVRYDKPVDECLTINELLELTKSNKSVIKLNKRNIDLDEILKTKAKKIKRKEIMMPTLLDDTKVSDLLENFTIHILNSSERYDKEKIENLIRKAGGTVSYRINNKVDIVLVSAYTEKVKAIVGTVNKFDLISTDWLQRVIEDGNLLGYEEDEVYRLGYNYKNCLSNELDIYGDSFSTETTVEKLKKVFARISAMGEFSNQSWMISWKTRKNFRDDVAYFDRYSDINRPDSGDIYDSCMDELEFRYYGGTVSEELTDSVTIVVYDNEDRKSIVDDYLTRIGRPDVKVVRKNFIY